MASANVEHSHDPGPYEIFDYPGGYDKVPDGKNYAKVRMAEIESQYATAHAATSARAIFAGCTFTLQDHPACDPEEYLITSVAYQLQNDDIGGGAGRTRSVPAFQAQITCIPHKYAFRSQRLTPKPIVQGPQTAVVVGPKGEEIHTDKHGQVKVKFFWDRDPKKDETSSCWVRVSQPSAGLGWGSLNIPRIGQEVIVDFLEGDPDRPIITGRVYNGVNMPPNNLPGAQVLTSFKSNSSKGGGGFNEITLDDTKGKENVFIHGEYDMNVRVKHDRMETIVNDQHLVVQNNTYLNVTADVHENIGGNMQENIGGDHSENIGGKEAKAVGGSMSLNVSGDVAEKFGANHSETTGSKITFKTPHFVIVADTISFKASGNTVAIGPGGVTIKVQGDLKIESSGSTKIKAGTAFKAEALSSKLEGSVIVKVSGLVAKVEADTSLSLKGGTGAKMEGAKIDVSADGPCIVKGAVIMLN
jgi:type VI secretion system secreted protein VgrG